MTIRNIRNIKTSHEDRAKRLRVRIWEMRETSGDLIKVHNIMNCIDNVYHKFLFIISSNTRTKGCAMKLRDSKI